MVFRSFQAGFLKQLDLDFYRRLKLATAKRIYRFLDKRFHFSSSLRFKLPVFACEHIGLSRSYDAAQLKRRLSPGDCGAGTSRIPDSAAGQRAISPCAAW